MDEKATTDTLDGNHPVVCEYEIGKTRYVVIADTAEAASEKAATKVSRLIRNEINNNPGRPGK